MEELEKNAPGDTKVIKPPLRERFDNFWYHYKWHSIVAIFLIVAILICTLQMCTRTSYDIHLTYAGYHEIKRTAPGGSSPYNEAVTSLSKLCEDFNGDGEIHISFQTLFVVNEEEKDMLVGDDKNLQITESLVREDTDTLRSELVYGDQYVFLLSERLFKEYESAFEGALFRSLEEFSEGNTECVFASGTKTGVYLSSLKISSLPVLCDLPDDTVVCIRELSEVSQIFGKSQNEENYRRGIEVIKNFFAYS